MVLVALTTHVPDFTTTRRQPLTAMSLEPSASVFVLSATVSFLIQPLAWAGMLIASGAFLIFTRPQAARRLLFCGIALWALVGWIPLPSMLLQRLEDEYSRPAGHLDRYIGLVVLGGAVEPPSPTGDRGEVSLNEAAERMTVPVSLIREHPHWVLVFTGGNSSLVSNRMSAADRAKDFFGSMGINASQAVYERRARTTRENALFTSSLPSVNKGADWLLVTSAWHMRRAMQVFRACGWSVTPFPVDYRTSKSTDWLAYSTVDGANLWYIVLHEHLGFAYYQLLSRIGRVQNCIGAS